LDRIASATAVCSVIRIDISTSSATIDTPGFCRDVERPGQAAVRQPSFSHRQISVQVFVCLYGPAVNEWLLARG
jgi:hypothetical protein